jgi:hypothetical protein
MICMRLENSFCAIISFCYKNILQKVIELGQCKHLYSGHAYVFPRHCTGSNFTLGVVQVMYDGSIMMSKEISTVIDSSILCIYICVTIFSGSLLSLT